MRYHKGSKLKDPEHYYMTLLQLYWPWRDETSLKDGFLSYQEKFENEEPFIKSNIERHDCFFGIYDDDEDMIGNVYQSSDNENETCADEFGMLNPNLLDLEPETSEPVHRSVPSSVVENISLPREVFFEHCSHLNEGQQHIFNFIMKYSQSLMLNSRNDILDPDPFFIFLTGGAGVGKSFVVNCITEYLRKTLKYPGQNFDQQPSVKVTASTGKAATNINGTTLHSAFKLPVNTPGTIKRTEPSKTDLPIYQERYRYLKVLIIDEISMTDKDTFNDLNIWLRRIMKRDDVDFGGISILVVGDFFQLPPGNQRYIIKDMSPTDAWYNFEMKELTEIVRQSSDPSFAELLNRLREGNHTNEDVRKITSLEQNDESDWPEDHVRLYITNDLKDKWNDVSTQRLLQESSDRIVYEFTAIDSKVDARTGAYQITVDSNLPITQTGNLPKTLKVCIGNLVMLTINKDAGDKLINGSIGTVVHIESRVQCGKASGVIYVKFEEDVGKTYKNSRLRGELKNCVPITVTNKKFFIGKKSNIWVERKQFPLALAHALTIHKSQGSTYTYMTGDMNRTTRSGKGTVPMFNGMFYTLLSRSKTSDKVKILNFNVDCIKVSEVVKEEMARLRHNRNLSWKHPLFIMGNVNSICLLNIVSWNLHMPHIVSDKCYMDNSDVFCFTETHTTNSSVENIEDYAPGWRSIHHPHSQHGLAICYKSDKVVVVKEFPTVNEIEMLPVLLKIDDEQVLVILVYQPPGRPQNVFPYQLLQQLERLDDIQSCRTILIGDFNADQLLPENVDAYTDLCQHFNFHQRCHYSTHIHGGILDLVFDTKKNNPVQWMPTPYSDHFVIMIDL